MICVLKINMFIIKNLWFYNFLQSSSRYCERYLCIAVECLFEVAALALCIAKLFFICFIIHNCCTNGKL